MSCPIHIIWCCKCHFALERVCNLLDIFSQVTELEMIVNVDNIERVWVSEVL